MSWSFGCLGKPAAVADALDKYSEKLNGQSRVEFDDAKPHLIALVKENFVKEGTGYNECLLDFEASGSGSSRGTAGNVEQLQRSITVSIRPTYKTLV